LSGSLVPDPLPGILRRAEAAPQHTENPVAAHLACARIHGLGGYLRRLTASKAERPIYPALTLGGHARNHSVVDTIQRKRWVEAFRDIGGVRLARISPRFRVAVAGYVSRADSVLRRPRHN